LQQTVCLSGAASQSQEYTEQVDTSEVSDINATDH